MHIHFFKHFQMDGPNVAVKVEATPYTPHTFKVHKQNNNYDINMEGFVIKAEVELKSRINAGEEWTVGWIQAILHAKVFSVHNARFL